MELDVTNIVGLHLDGKVPARWCSGSAAELGSNAREITWNHALEVSESLNVCKDEEVVQAIREHIHEYGAWETSEINGFSDIELGAFVVQEVAAEVRRLEEGEGLDLTDFTEEEFEAATRNEGGNLFGGCACVPEHQSQWFFYLGT